LNSSLYDEETGEIEDVPWNFAKFLVSGEGEVLKYYTPTTDTEVIEEDIEKYLSE